MGVYDAAVGFFQMVIEAITPDTIPRQPVASASNYCIASHAVEMTCDPSPQSKSELGPILRSYSEIIKAINPKSPFVVPDVDVLSQASHFFDQIVRDGESELYEHFARFADPAPPAGLR